MKTSAHQPDPKRDGDEPTSQVRDESPIAAQPGTTTETPRLIRYFLIGALSLLLLRLVAAAPLGVPSGSMRPALLEGDVVLVSLLSYHIRSPRTFPFTDLRIPQIDIAGLEDLDRGDVVLFHSPEPGRRADDDRLIKRAAAIAGDTIRLVRGVLEINGRRVRGDGVDTIATGQIDRLLRDERTIVIPFEGYELPLTDSLTAAAWSETLWREAGVEVSYRNGIVFLSGRPVTRYRFGRDYFLPLGDNANDSRDGRHFGPVPYEALIGQIVCVLWSREPGRGSVRWGRTLRVMKNSKFKVQN